MTKGLRDHYFAARESASAMRPTMSAKRPSHSSRLLLASVAIGYGIAATGAVVEQPYPNRTIKLVVPYVAGGPTDIVARAIADKLSISLRRPIVTENRPGAGGNIGTEAVVKAPPDGHTLGLLVNTTLTATPIRTSGRFRLLRQRARFWWCIQLCRSDRWRNLSPTQRRQRRERSPSPTPALASALLVTWRWNIFAGTPVSTRFTSRIEALHRWSSTS